MGHVKTLENEAKVLRQKAADAVNEYKKMELEHRKVEIECGELNQDNAQMRRELLYMSLDSMERLPLLRLQYLYKDYTEELALVQIALDKAYELRNEDIKEQTLCKVCMENERVASSLLPFGGLSALLRSCQ